MGQAGSLPGLGVAEEENLYDNDENGHQNAVLLAHDCQRPEYGQSSRHQAQASDAVAGEALAAADVSEQGGQGEQSAKFRHALGHVQHGADEQRCEQPAGGDPQRHPTTPSIHASHGPREQPVREEKYQHAAEQVNEEIGELEGPDPIAGCLPVQNVAGHRQRPETVMLKDGFVPGELTTGEASNRLQGRGVVQYQIAGETGPVNCAR